MRKCNCGFTEELDRDHRSWCSIYTVHSRVRRLREEVGNQIDSKMEIAQEWANALVELQGLKIQIENVSKERDILGREADRLRKDFADQFERSRVLLDTICEVQSVMHLAMEDGASAESMYLAVKAVINGGPLCPCTHADDEHGPYGCVDECGCEYLPRRKKENG